MVRMSNPTVPRPRIAATSSLSVRAAAPFLLKPKIAAEACPAEIGGELFAVATRSAKRHALGRLVIAHECQDALRSNRLDVLDAGNVAA
jgi:hypothetical protein